MTQAERTGMRNRLDWWTNADLEEVKAMVDVELMYRAHPELRPDQYRWALEKPAA